MHMINTKMTLKWLVHENRRYKVSSNLKLFLDTTYNSFIIFKNIGCRRWIINKHLYLYRLPIAQIYADLQALIYYLTNKGLNKKMQKAFLEKNFVTCYHKNMLETKMVEKD